MKLIRKARLYFKEGNSDKVYEVDLCRLSGERYVVNFRYGRRGTNLREGTKTTEPVDRQTAEKVFDSIVVSKTNKGYKDADRQPYIDEPAPKPVKTKNAAQASLHRKRIRTAILKRFRDAVERSDHAVMRRTVWRIGELAIKKAEREMAALIPARDETLNYCVAWALGRCAQPKSRRALDELYEKTGSDAVKRITWEARLATSTTKQRADLMAEIIQRLPRAVQEALTADDTNQLAAAASGMIFQGGPQGMDLIEDLYRVASATPCARRFVLSALSELPLKPGYFRAVRRIFKAAEFRNDVEVISLLALRFETEPSQFHVPGGMNSAVIPNTWEYVKISKEASKDDSRLAFSDRTRNYFRKRVWRSMRKLGSVDDPIYVTIAEAVLLAFSDQHATAPKKSIRYRWETDGDGRWHSVPEATREYGKFGKYLAFNHILYGNSQRYRLSPNGMSWLKVASAGDTSEDAHSGIGSMPREESFPHLWDANPEALYRLLTQSRCAPVHEFGVRALADNTGFCNQFATEQIMQLLVQPYAVTIELGVRLARDRYDPAHPDTDLVKGLLTADLQSARDTARQWVDDRPDMLLDSADLAIHILTSSHDDIRQWGRTLIETIDFTSEQVKGLIARLVVFLMTLEDQAEKHEPVVADVGDLLLGPWADACRRIKVGIISDLFNHPYEAIQVLAGKLLLQHHTPPAELPPELLRRLIESTAKAVRGIGVKLFAGLPDEWLLKQADLIFSFCTSEEDAVRRAALPMVKQLAIVDETFGGDLFERLFPLVFRKPPTAEYRDDLVGLLTDALEKQALQLDDGTIWRLLQARAYGARQMGAHLLEKSDPSKFSVRQWARLGGHALLAVRQWSWNAYGDHPAEIAGNMADGLRLLDSDWDDTREFAISYFREKFTAEHWTPTLLVSICDSIREDVQRFGRELITIFFDKVDGHTYLLQLSQHPSINVQLFATNFLEDYARGDLERIERLTPYFITVLSQVNCGRVAKARIFKFLHSTALESAEAAALVTPVINRISATIAIGDRGACVQLLRDINQAYPHIDTVLETIPLPRRPIHAKEADHAV